jgi:serine/threonine protein kinase
VNTPDQDDAQRRTGTPNSGEPTHSAPTLPPPAEALTASALPSTSDNITQPPTRSAHPAVEGIGRLPVVPGYEIIAEIGRGGMGVVFKARQIKLNRLVALKMILGGNYATHADLVRFMAEAEAVAALQHPNIVQIFEIGQHDGLPYFTLEFVEGGTLSDKVREHPLPAREAAVLVEQIARGVQFAHDKGKFSARQVTWRPNRPTDKERASGRPSTFMLWERSSTG